MTEEEENEIELIEAYYKDMLPADASQKLKERMAVDPDFAERVESYIDIFNGIKTASQEEFKKTVAGWDAGIRQEEKPLEQNVFLRRWSIAAAFLLLGAAVLFLLFPSEKSPGELYVAYFTPYEDVINVRDQGDPVLSDALHAYHQKEYREAKVNFQEYIKNHPEDLNVRFYLGLSLMESNETEKGILQLDEVISKNGLLREQAEWYKALGYLKLGRVEESKKLLEKMAVADHDYQGKSAQLLREL